MRDERKHGRFRTRWWLIALAIFGCLLIAARLAAPTVIERFIEESALKDMPDGYHGSLEGVDVRVLSAEIALLGLKIEKKNGLVPVPFMTTEEFVIDTVRDGWQPRTTLRLQAPVMNYVDAPSEAAKQKGPPFDLHQFGKQLPFELSQVTIRDGEVHFWNFQPKPPMDAHVRDLNVDWTKLVGCLPPGSGACRSELTGNGRLLDSGMLTLQGRFERAPKTDFNVDATVRDLKAARLSPLLSHYAKVDVQGGQIDLDARYHHDDQGDHARIVPHIDDLEVLGGERKDTQFFRELGLAAAAGWFERKSGEKAIILERPTGGKLGVRVVDAPAKSADRQK